MRVRLGLVLGLELGIRIKVRVDDLRSIPKMRGEEIIDHAL